MGVRLRALGAGERATRSRLQRLDRLERQRRKQRPLLRLRQRLHGTPCRRRLHDVDEDAAERQWIMWGSTTTRGVLQPAVRGRGRYRSPHRRFAHERERDAPWLVRRPSRQSIRRRSDSRVRRDQDYKSTVTTAWLRLINWFRPSDAAIVRRLIEVAAVNRASLPQREYDRPG